MNDYPNDYHEQVLLKAIVIGNMRGDIGRILIEFDEFLDLVGDCCVCDILCTSFKYAKKYREKVFEYLGNLAKSNDEFRQRVVAVMTMSHFLANEYIVDALKLIGTLHSTGYYAEMGVGWAIATAFAKYRAKTQAVLNNNLITDGAFNFAVKKICVSSRVSDSDKKY